MAALRKSGGGDSGRDFPAESLPKNIPRQSPLGKIHNKFPRKCQKINQRTPCRSSILLMSPSTQVLIRIQGLRFGWGLSHPTSNLVSQVPSILLSKCHMNISKSLPSFHSTLQKEYPPPPPPRTAQPPNLASCLQGSIL